ncbi:MAG: alpha/beta fold hydrolase [Sphingomonadaceae bacterium]
MRLTRHFVDVANPDGSRRRVHYRRMGEGPPVLLVHQSPRSSAEWEPLMREWAEEFTLIAPDTPGFGQSAPLPIARPAIGDYADAVLAFLDAMGIARIAAYGFHSGAIILMTAIRKAPHRFTAVACGGYAVWTAEEQADFGARYTPPFHPLAYGEHLAFAWNRVLEQSWFFPWYRATPANRLGIAGADPAKIHEMVMEILTSGNAYTLGYGAVLAAPRDIPAPDAPVPPVLIAAYDGDPLQAHIDRLGVLPEGWQARKVPAPADLAAAAKQWVAAHPAPMLAQVPVTPDEGFVEVTAGGFQGLLHWQGEGERLWLHAPGSAGALAPTGTLALDCPGHGLSDGWADAATDLASWAEVIVAGVTASCATIRSVAGEGWSDVLAAAVAARLGVQHEAGPRPRGAIADWRAMGLPDVTPCRFGEHLHRAWGAVRAATFFDPWFQPMAANAIDFDPADAEPERLAIRHLALLRASAAPALLGACLEASQAR